MPVFAGDAVLYILCPFYGAGIPHCCNDIIIFYYVVYLHDQIFHWCSAGMYSQFTLFACTTSVRVYGRISQKRQQHLSLAMHIIVKVLSKLL